WSLASSSDLFFPIYCTFFFVVLSPRLHNSRSSCHHPCTSKSSQWWLLSVVLPFQPLFKSPFTSYTIMWFSISLILLAVTGAIHSMNIPFKPGSTGIESVYTHPDGREEILWRPFTAAPQSLNIIRKASNEEFLEAFGKIIKEALQVGWSAVQFHGVGDDHNIITHAVWDDWRAVYPHGGDRIVEISKHDQKEYARWVEKLRNDGVPL
ncbi:hypothetical protein BC835DRAFT_1482897, partial [Cytidiella melzeri]